MKEVHTTPATDTQRLSAARLDWMRQELEAEFPACSAVVEYRGDKLYFGLFPSEGPA